MNSRVVLRPPFGQALTVVVGLICVVCEAAILTTQGLARGVHMAPLIALAAYVCWLLFWAPAVIIDPAGVYLRNVVRTRHITWPAIQRVDTKYALTLHTPGGKYTAWAAPAPSRFTMINATKQDVARLPDSTYGPGRSIGPGDLPKSDSGVAAYYVRERWEALRDAGHLDSGVIEHSGVVTTWNLRSMLALVGLIGLTALSAVI